MTHAPRTSYGCHVWGRCSRCLKVGPGGAKERAEAGEGRGLVGVKPGKGRGGAELVVVGGAESWEGLLGLSEKD